MGGLFLWVGAPRRVKGHAEVPPCKPRPPGSLELGNLQSRAASLALIPATQPASPSWVLTKNLGRHPLRLLKVPKGFTSCSLPGLGRCELGQDGPKDRPRARGGPPHPQAGGSLCLLAARGPSNRLWVEASTSKRLGPGPRLSPDPRQS